jgi:uncharacterized membrane protein
MKLRILGIITFLLFILYMMFCSSENPGFAFTQVQQLLIITSVGSFAIVIALQLYRLYINVYAKEEESDQ